MTSKLSGPLVDLLNASEPESIQNAWTTFVERYSDLMLKATRSQTASYDRSMDRYAYVLEGLRSDDYRRLRSYSPRSTSSFRSWLYVVSARLCNDFERSRYGRIRGSESREADARLRLRRRLAELAGADVDVDRIAGPPDEPLQAVAAHERLAALDRAIETLDPSDRLLVLLRFGEELPVREIGRAMGFPTVFHVYRRLKKVLTALREELTAQGIGGPQ